MKKNEYDLRRFVNLESDKSTKMSFNFIAYITSKKIESCEIN